MALGLCPNLDATGGLHLIAVHTFKHPLITFSQLDLSLDASDGTAVLELGVRGEGIRPLFRGQQNRMRGILAELLMLLT